MAFWRRSKGRHALGAAVTSIPAAPRAASVPAAPAVAPLPAPWDAAVPPAVQALPTGPRVELTFRDGSSASLDPLQAKALDEIAQLLTSRDEVKH
jgi:hypothetical protein